MWGRDPILKKEGFDKLKSAMLSFGCITRDVPYDQCVDTSLAEQVVSEEPTTI